LEAKKRIDLAEWLGCAIPSMHSLVFFVPATEFLMILRVIRMVWWLGVDEFGSRVIRR
jgi:hypothetical protein